MEYYIKSNKLGLYSQIISIGLKAFTYLFILKFISPSVYSESVFQLTIMGFSLILSDSGGSSSIFSHKKLNDKIINQYFSSSITYSLILTSLLLIFSFFQKGHTNEYIYIIISFLVLISPANNVLISVIQKFEFDTFFYFSRNFRDLFAFLIALFLIYIGSYKFALFLPQLIGELSLFIFLFKFINNKIIKIKYSIVIEREIIQRNYYLFCTKILNYFSLNWIYLGIVNFNMVDVATLNMANSFWKNISDSIKNIFQKSYIMIPYTNSLEVANNSKYFLKFNFKYLIPLVIFSTFFISVFMNYYAQGIWFGSVKFIIIYGIYGSLLFLFPPLTPVYIVNDKSNQIFNNSVIQFMLNLVTIVIIYIFKIPLIFSFILTLGYHVVSYFMLFTGLKKIFI